MNDGNVYLYVAARTPDINDGKYWMEGKYDGKRGCVADPTLRNGAGDCLTAKYRNTVSMGSGSIPSVSTSETSSIIFRKPIPASRTSRTSTAAGLPTAKASPEPIMCAPTGMD